jgi:hypothetical protein
MTLFQAFLGTMALSPLIALVLYSQLSTLVRHWQDMPFLDGFF